MQHLPYQEDPAYLRWLVESSYQEYITARRIAVVPVTCYPPLSVDNSYYRSLSEYFLEECGTHGSLCDVGCGVGRTSFDLARYGWAVIGIDASQVFVNFCRELQLSGGCKSVDLNLGGSEAQLGELSCPVSVSCDFVLGDVKRLEFTDGQFDAVLFSNVLDRLDDPPGALMEIWRILKPGGRLIASSPFDWQLEYTPQISRWVRDFRVLFDSRHWRICGEPKELQYRLRINERYVQHYCSQVISVQKIG